MGDLTSPRSMSGVVGVGGPNVAIYESYWKQVDPVGSGRLGAVEAAGFLKRSRLREGVLHDIWEQCDPQGCGFLDKQTFFLAMKLIALVQNGKEPTMENLSLSTPPPNMGMSMSPVHEQVWDIKETELDKFNQIFESLGPVNGLLSGDKVKPIFLNSKLSVDILGRIWDLSDIDQDGFLDSVEFAVAMYLVYKALQNETVPVALPVSLIPPTKRQQTPTTTTTNNIVLTSTTDRNTPVLSNLCSSTHSSPTVVKRDSEYSAGWVVAARDKANYDSMFRKIDTDCDGLVTGVEVKEIFIQSRLPQNDLAHLWNLCDMKQIGKLNCEQFALAMYLIQQKVKGIDLPVTLTPDMIPPTARPKPTLDNFNNTLNGSQTSLSSSGSASNDQLNVKEFDMIRNELTSLSQEREQLLREIRQHELIVQQKEDDNKMLETDLEHSKMQLKMFDKQKQEGDDQLLDIDETQCKLQTMLIELQKQCQDDNIAITSLEERVALQSNDTDIHKTEEELEKLKREEDMLSEKVEQSRHLLTDLKQQIDKMEQLKTAQTSSMKSVEMRHTLSKHPTITSTTPTIGSEIGSLSEFSILGKSFDDDDPFKSKSDPFSDPFTANDPFTDADSIDDPFKDQHPFHDDDPFCDVNDVFSNNNNNNDNDFGGPVTDDLFNNEAFSGMGALTAGFSVTQDTDKALTDIAVFDDDPFEPASSVKPSRKTPPQKPPPPARPPPPKASPKQPHTTTTTDISAVFPTVESTPNTVTTTTTPTPTDLDIDIFGSSDAFSSPPSFPNSASDGATTNTKQQNNNNNDDNDLFAGAFSSTDLFSSSSSSNINNNTCPGMGSSGNIGVSGISASLTAVALADDDADNDDFFSGLSSVKQLANSQDILAAFGSIAPNTTSSVDISSNNTQTAPVTSDLFGDDPFDFGGSETLNNTTTTTTNTNNKDPFGSFDDQDPFNTLPPVMDEGKSSWITPSSYLADGEDTV